MDKKAGFAFKKLRLMVLNGTVLNVASTPEMRNMPLSLDNDLLAAVFRFGTTSEDEIPFACHLDTFAAMNTGNLHLCQWFIKIIHTLLIVTSNMTMLTQSTL